jgi:dTDP-4-dehydrorhamnose 3,5-epimerase
MPPLSVTAGPLGGLWIVELEVHEDPDRQGASFRETFQAEKLEALGLPRIAPVQWNVAESRAGTLRGFHAEPWDKYVHVVAGEAFAAIADVRQDSPTAGQVWTGTLDRGRALLVTQGLGNAYQALTDPTVYAYLVTEHWRPGVPYPAVVWDDPDLAVDWPITDERLALSAKDRTNLTLRELWAS